MSEAQPPVTINVSSEAETSEGALPELTPAQLEQLSDLVYRLLKDELIQSRERRGEHSDRGWR